MAGGLNKQVLMVGRGKMAANVGSFFLQKGCGVTWLVRGDDGLPELEKQVGKIVRRLARAQGVEPSQFRARICVAEDPSLEKPDLVIECVQEDAKTKKRALVAITPLLDEQTMVWSTSSSILPQEIHHRALGVHFFYPLELIDVVEVVVPAGCSAEMRQRTVTLLQMLGFQCLVQREQQAFAINRLLVPLQAELFCDLAAGWAPEVVDVCSASSLLPMGQLAFMDGVGLDVLHAAVGNYVARMTAGEAKSYDLLRAHLARIVESGKIGNKVRNGLLCGDRVTWGERAAPRSAADKNALKTKYRHLFIHSCLAAVEREMISTTGLQMVLRNVYQSDASLSEVVKTEAPHRVYKTMETNYRKTGRAYFAPSSSLRNSP